MLELVSGGGTNSHSTKFFQRFFLLFAESSQQAPCQCVNDACTYTADLVLHFMCLQLKLQILCTTPQQSLGDSSMHTHSSCICKTPAGQWKTVTHQCIAQERKQVCILHLCAHCFNLDRGCRPPRTRRPVCRRSAKLSDMNAHPVLLHSPDHRTPSRRSHLPAKTTTSLSRFLQTQCFFDPKTAPVSCCVQHHAPTSYVLFGAQKLVFRPLEAL